MPSLAVASGGITSCPLATAALAALKKDGVTVLDKIETYDYGKFVHILDVEGNKIEGGEAHD